MGFQVHLRLKNDKLLLQTLFVQAEEMIFLEMILKGIVVNVILLLPTRRTAVAYVASLVTVTTVRVEFVIAVESLAAKSTFRMSSETTLIQSSWHIITVLLVFTQLCHSEKFMLMREDLLVPSAKIAE
jgi:hypothetical protein